MNRGEANGIEAQAMSVLYHNPPKRSKPNSATAQLLDLPDEILAAIFEHYTAPLVKGPVFREECLLLSAEHSQIMWRLSLVNKRIARLALPLIWRHLCENHAYSSQIYWDTRIDYRVHSDPSPLSHLPLHLVHSLDFEWSLDLYDGLDEVAPLLLEGCKNLRYVKLDLLYTPILGEDHRDWPEFKQIERLALLLGELRYIVHLHLNFRETNEVDGGSPVERYIETITKVCSKSLRGLTLGGLSDLFWTGFHDRERVICLDEALNYPALTTIRFCGDGPGKYVSHVLERLSAISNLRSVGFGKASTEALSAIPPKIRPEITSLDLAGEESVDPDMLLSFASLQSLASRIADLKHSSHMVHSKLQELTLTDKTQAVSEWIRDYLSTPEYMPQLRLLRIFITSTSTLHEGRDSLAMEIPQSRRIHVEVTYQSGYDME
jgi:hypothetical protein